MIHVIHLKKLIHSSTLAELARKAVHYFSRSRVFKALIFEQTISEAISSTGAAAGNQEPVDQVNPEPDLFPDPDVIAQWQAVLSGAADQLIQLSTSTESEFLSLGDRLADITDSCNRNASLAKTVSEEVVKSRLNDLDVLESILNSGFEKVDYSESLLQQLFSELKGTVDNIDGIIQLNELLNRTFRALRMVRVMIRIETENAGAIDFFTVADALISLEKMINQNASQINEVAQQTGGLIQKTLGQFKTDLENRRKPLKQDQIRITDLTATIRSELSAISITCRQMSETAQSIGQEISRIVMHLQFHDNYRQRLEHISHTLLEVRSRLGSTHPDPAFLKSWLCTVLHLQIVQLAKLKDESLDVSQELSESFDKSQSLMDEQIRSADQTMPVMAAQEGHVTDLDHVLRSFCSDMDAYRESDRELLTSMSRLGELVTGITDISKLIESNEFSLRLLALNSIIKASAIGKQGKTLAVLSREINAISRTVQSQISSRSGIISAIHQSAETVISRLLTNLTESTGVVNRTFQSTGESILKLLEKDETAEKCSRLSNRLKSDFSTLKDQFAFSRIVEPPLKEAMERLQELHAQIEEQMPGSLQQADLEESEIKDLLERYTMQSEREIHRAARGFKEHQSQDQSALSDNIEWNSSSSEASDNEDLGENVELF